MKSIKKAKILRRNFSNSVLRLFFVSLLSFQFCTPIISKQDITDILSSEYLFSPKEDEYILGPGDILRISISEDLPKLLNEYQISIEGFIYVPRLQKIYVSGLTSEELKILLENEYKKYFKNPNIQIEILNYRTVRVYLDGEVNDPGLYRLPGASLELTHADLNKEESEEKLIYPTLFSVLRKGGGITEYSDLTEVSIIRKESISNGGGKKIAKINYLEMIDRIDPYNMIRIYDGDRISIKRSEKSYSEQLKKAIKSNLNPREINVYVSGRVEEKGLKVLQRTASLNEAIQMSGGLSTLSNNVKLVRYKPDGEVVVRKIKYKSSNKRGTYENPYLNDGDLIYVEKGKLESFNKTSDQITNPLDKLVKFVILWRFFSD